MEEKIIKESELARISPLTLAYLGDTVYESYIREYLIKRNIFLKINDLHKSAIKYVSAHAQSKAIKGLEDILTEEEIEKYSIIRTVTAVERADVVIIVIDAVEGVTEQDAKIAGIAHENGKGIIIAVNKWDAIEKNDKTVYEYTNKVRDILSFMPYAEMLFISAETGQRLPKLFDTIDAVIENHAMRVGTGVLNEILSEAVAMKQPPSDKGRRLRLYYITQVSVKPPTFVIFINDKELTHFSYTRYIENQIRETFGFRGTPLRFIYRERKDKG